MPEPVQLGFVTMRSAEERARRLLAGDTQIPLSREEEIVLRTLLFHVGHGMPIARRELERKTGLSERDVKAVIRNLLVTHEVRIGASRGKDHGYFLIATADDLAVAGNPLIGEMKELARRLRVLYGPETVAELYGQLRIDDKEKSA